MSKPVVAHLVHRYLFLTGSWIYHQLTNLTHHRPIVLTTEIENQDQFPFEAVYCYHQPFRGKSLWQIGLRKAVEGVTQRRYRFYVAQTRQQDARLLHAHFGTEGYHNLAVRRAVDLPLVTTFYGDDVSKLPKSQPQWRQRYHKLFAEGSLFLAEGSHMAQCLVNLGCQPDKVIVQHLGVEADRIAFQARFKQPNEPVRILITASFREKKGIPYGVRAFASAVHKYPAMELRIIGGAKSASEQALMDECRALAAQEKVADKVHFLGYTPYTQYLQEIQKAHLFLAPSVTATDGDTEGGAPVSVIEASAAGLPVISSRHCDIPEVILDGRTGVLAPERDVDALADAILRLATTPEAWPQMGNAGRLHIETEYNIHKQVQRLETIYSQLLV